MSTFLYPRQTQYLLDVTCAKIVHTLVDHRNNPAEAKLVYYDYPHKTAFHVMLITTNECQITFGRIQGKLPDNKNDIAGVHEVVIPHFWITLSNNPSEVRVRRYNGTDWAFDRREFFNKKDLRKHNKRSHIYTLYEPNGDAPEGFGYRRSGTHLFPSTCKDLEYEPKDTDPPYLTTTDVFEQANAWLEAHFQLNGSPPSG